MSFKQKKPILLAAILMCAPQLSSASLIVYTDRGSWESAISGTVSNENFNGLSAYNFSFGSNYAGSFNIDISGEYTALNRIEDSTADSLSIDGSNFYLGNVRTGSPTTYSDLLFSENINAFGADWVGSIGFGNLVAEVAGVNVNFTDHFTGTGTTAGTGFLGVISSEAFNHVALSAQSGTTNEAFGMDNVAFSTTSSVPVPASAWLFGSGLIGLIGLAKRNNKK